MKYKLLITLLTTLSSAFTSFKDDNSSFKYRYLIKANSFSPADEMALYYCKEKVIDIYEDIALALEEKYQLAAIKNNISLFSYTSGVNAYYQDGIIKVIIGNGKGSSISGNFRKNYCDESVIREKIYIFDLLK